MRGGEGGEGAGGDPAAAASHHHQDPTAAAARPYRHELCFLTPASTRPAGGGSGDHNSAAVDSDGSTTDDGGGGAEGPAPAPPEPRKAEAPLELVGGENFVSVTAAANEDECTLGVGPDPAPSGGGGVILLVDVDGQYVAVKDIREGGGTGGSAGQESTHEAAGGAQIYLLRRKRRQLLAAATAAASAGGYDTDDENGDYLARGEQLSVAGGGEGGGGSYAAAAAGAEYGPPEPLPRRQMRLLHRGDRLVVRFGHRTIRLEYHQKRRLEVDAAGTDDADALMSTSVDADGAAKVAFAETGAGGAASPPTTDGAVRRLIGIPVAVGKQSGASSDGASTSAAVVVEAKKPNDADGPAAREGTKGSGSNPASPIPAVVAAPADAGLAQSSGAQKSAGRSSAQSPEQQQKCFSQSPQVEGDDDDEMEEYSYLTGEVIMKDQGYVSAITGDDEAANRALGIDPANNAVGGVNKTAKLAGAPQIDGKPRGRGTEEDAATASAVILDANVKKKVTIRGDDDVKTGAIQPPKAIEFSSQPPNEMPPPPLTVGVTDTAISALPSTQRSAKKSDDEVCDEGEVAATSSPDGKESPEAVDVEEDNAKAAPPADEEENFADAQEQPMFLTAQERDDDDDSDDETRDDGDKGTGGDAQDVEMEDVHDANAAAGSIDSDSDGSDADNEQEEGGALTQAYPMPTSPGISDGNDVNTPENSPHRSRTSDNASQESIDIYDQPTQPNPALRRYAEDSPEKFDLDTQPFRPPAESPSPARSSQNRGSVAAALAPINEESAALKSPVKSGNVGPDDDDDDDDDSVTTAGSAPLLDEKKDTAKAFTTNKTEDESIPTDAAVAALSVPTSVAGGDTPKPHVAAAAVVAAQETVADGDIDSDVTEDDNAITTEAAVGAPSALRSLPTSDAGDKPSNIDDSDSETEDENEKKKGGAKRIEEEKAAAKAAADEAEAKRIEEERAATETKAEEERIAAQKKEEEERAAADAAVKASDTPEKKESQSPSKRQKKGRYSLRDSEEREAKEGIERQGEEDGSIRVIITGITVTKQHKKMVESIGGELIEKVDDAIDATHAIAGDGKVPLRRTPKLMICVCKTPNILNLDWLTKSSKAKEPLDAKDFLLLDDTSAEKTYGFNMKDTLENGEAVRSQRGGLLGGWSIHFCKGVAGKKAPPEHELRLIVAAAGGMFLKTLSARATKDADTSKVIIITSDPATAAQKSDKDVKRLTSQGARVFTTKWFFHSIITQHLSEIEDEPVGANEEEDDDKKPAASSPKKGGRKRKAATPSSNSPKRESRRRKR